MRNRLIEEKCKDIIQLFKKDKNIELSTYFISKNSGMSWNTAKIHLYTLAVAGYIEKRDTYIHNIKTVLWRLK